MQKFMKILLMIIPILFVIPMCYAEDDVPEQQEQTQEDNTPPKLAATTYVTGAYNALNGAKVQAARSYSGSGNMVTDITVDAAEGITIQKSNIQIPNGSASGNGSYSPIWID